jgi:hypothetical protein
VRVGTVRLGPLRPDAFLPVALRSGSGWSGSGWSGSGWSGSGWAARPVPYWALISAALAPVLLVTGWLTAGALQPASYSPIRQTVSVMSGYGGTDRWIVTAALLLVGGCYAVTAAGLSRLTVRARFLLLLSGLSSIGIAAFPEPVHGSSSAHVAWAVLGAVTIAVWPAFTVRPGAGAPLILNFSGCAAATAVFVVLLGWLFIQTQGGADLGLAERLTSGVQTSWPFAVALALWRRPSPGGPPADGVRPEALPAETLPADALPADPLPADGLPAAAGNSQRRAGCRT